MIHMSLRKYNLYSLVEMDIKNIHNLFVMKRQIYFDNINTF